MRKIVNYEKNKKKLVTITAAAVATILVTSFATLGTAPFSVQQPQGQGPSGGPPGLEVTSDNIVDGEVRNQDLADDAVTTEKIEDGQVTTDDLADDAVTSEKIADGEVTSADVADGTITSTDIAEGTIPPPGGGTPNVHVAFGPRVFVPAQEDRTSIARCPDGFVVIGGGFDTSSVAVYYSAPTPLQNNAAGWEIRAFNPFLVGDSRFPIQAYAICMGPSPP